MRTARMIHVGARRTLRAAAMLALLGGCATGGSNVKVAAPQKSSEGETSSAASSAKAPAGPSARAQRTFDDANRSFEEASKSPNPDWPDVERKYKQVTAIDDSFAEPYFNLGVVYEKEHQTDKAEEAYRTALAKKPTLRQAAENLAVMEENSGKSEQAVEVYKDIAKKYPQDSGSRSRLAAIAAAAGQDDEALKLAREALMRDPKNVTAYKVMMRVYVDHKNLALAQLVALRATKLDASDPELYETIGQILLQQGDELGALEQFKKAIAVRDDYLPARLQLAQVAVRHRDFASATVQYQKIVQAQPKSAAAHLDLGIAYKGMGQVDKAFQEYDQVKKLDENNAEVYYAIGVIFEKNKNLPDKALDNYKTYIQKSGGPPNDHPVYQSIKNCEQLVAIAQQAEDEQKKAEEQKKEQELEKKNKDAADKAAAAEKAAPPQPAANPGAPAKPAGAQSSPTPAPDAKAAPATPASTAAPAAPKPEATPAADTAPPPEAKPASATPPPAKAPDPDEPPEGAGQ